MTNKDNLIRPALFRHLIIIIYDLLLLFSILLLATFIIVALNNGTAIGPGNPFFIAYYLLSVLSSMAGFGPMVAKL